MKKLSVVAFMLCLICSISFGQKLGLYAIGAGAGYVSVSNDIGSGFVIGAGANLGEIAKNLSLRPEIAFWSVSKSVGGVDLKTTDFIINANVIYGFPSEGSKLLPYIGGGLGFNALSQELTFLGAKISNSFSRIGINLLAGVSYAVSNKVWLHAEPRYVLASDVNHFAIFGGVAFGLK